jgi:predicted RNase H-like HicB family nuclease
LTGKATWPLSAEEKSMRLEFTVVLTKDLEDGGFNAVVPALPGCRTFGETKAEAYANALEAIAAYLGSLEAEGDPIPQEVGSRVVGIP